MITIQVRKQGGAAIMTIPSDVLHLLNIHVGSKLSLDVSKQSFTVSPLTTKKQKRYTLKELLHGATPKRMKSLNAKTEWARTGKSIGREHT